MMLSIVAIVVLVVVAVYALWMAATGRISGSDTTELSVGGRVVIAGVALLAFGIAYAATQRVGNGSQALADLTPEREVTTPANVSQAVRANPMPVGSTSDVTAPADSEAVLPAEPVAMAELPTGEMKSPDPKADRGEGLSESAAAMEAAARDRPTHDLAPALTTKPEKVRTAPVAVSEPAKIAQPLVPPHAVVSTQTRVAVPPRSRQPYGPLLIHIDNQLGGDQQAEQLTLSIEGKPVADIDIDGSRPAVTVAVSLPRPGKLFYRLEGLSEDGTGTRLKGSGCIRVDDGARYVVRRKTGSRKVFLERVKAA